MKKLLALMLTAVLSCLAAASVCAGRADITHVRTPGHAPSDENGYPIPSGEPAVSWIDRLGSLPDYAAAFYRWLESQAHEHGALADVTKGDRITLRDGSNAYVHTVTLRGEVSFSLPENCIGGEIGSYINRTIAEEMPYLMNSNFYLAARALLAAENAFDRDHPEVFWLSGACSWNTRFFVTSVIRRMDTVFVGYTQHIDYYLSCSYFDIRADEYRDHELIAADARMCEERIAEILSDAPTGSDAEIVSYFNDVLTHSNGYNTSDDPFSLPNRTRECVCALEGTCGIEGPVCEGYARAFKVLCDRAGIPCVLEDGTGRYSAVSKEVPHMWNLVCIDGEWYGADVTWNDPSSKTSSERISGSESDIWLFAGSEQMINGLPFSDSHIRQNRVMEPGIAFTNGPLQSQSSLYGK